MEYLKKKPKIMAGLILGFVLLCVFIAVITLNTPETTKAPTNSVTTEPSNENVAEMVPTKISEQQFKYNMEQYLAQSGVSATFEQTTLQGSGADCLLVSIYSERGGIGTQDQAYYLKNYMDLHPDFLGYNVLILAPTGNPATTQLTNVVYSVPATELIIQDIIMLEDGTPLSMDTETYPEATYKKIADAINTGYFTDDDDIVVFS